MSLFYLDTSINSSERFDMASFMAYTDNYDPLTSQFLALLNAIPVSGRYSVSFEISRPDLISFSIYGDTQYWWILLMYNNIISVEDISVGDILLFPSLNDLESLYFSLRTKERAS